MSKNFEFSFHSETPEKDYEDLRTYIIRYFIITLTKPSGLILGLDHMRSVYSSRLEFVDGEIFYFQASKAWYLSISEQISFPVKKELEQYTKGITNGTCYLFNIFIKHKENPLWLHEPLEYRDLEYFRNGIFHTTYLNIKKLVNSTIPEKENQPKVLFSAIRYAE